MLTLTGDFSSLTFPVSVFGWIAYFVSLGVIILAPSYIIADFVMELAER